MQINKFTYGETVRFKARKAMFIRYTGASKEFAIIWFDNENYQTVPTNQLCKPFDDMYLQIAKKMSSLMDRIKASMLHEGD